MAVRGFRSKIALNVALLVLVSAIITDILVVLVAQGVLVRDRLTQQRVLSETVARMVLDRINGFGALPREEQSPSTLAALTDSGWTAALVVDPAGSPVYTHTSPTYPLEKLKTATAEAIETGKPQFENAGLALGVFWWHPRTVLISLPIYNHTQLAGAVAAVVPLTALYAKLRQYNKPVFIYIILNTIILSLVGLYRIFRIYLRPIDRIIHQADDYGHDEDLIFAFRQEDNELNRLSSSLNRMLKRISEDKQRLKETVASLEKANEELKRAQSEIIRAEKMASVGRLAAGIAHEIGNPIGIVLGYLDLLKQSGLDKAEHDDFAQRAETEIQRINTIIRRLLDLARPEASRPEFISVHPVIEDIAEVMRHQPMMADIHIETILEAKEERIWANADQLRQVFLNLLLNAADAIRSAGRKLDGRIAIITTLGNGQPAEEKKWLIIRFEDNGEGIAADQLENIFDPFYTTKEPGKGTGLGLAVSFMIVEKMGGTISARSAAGQGTTLTIQLPVGDVKDSNQENSAHHGSETTPSHRKAP